MSLWIPPKVSKKLFEERLEYEQAVQLMLECEDPREDLNRVVAALDPDAAVLRAKPTVRTGFPLKPGYWHFIRRNPGAPMTVQPIEGPSGEYVDPTPSVLERMLRERDLQNPQVRRAMERREQERKALLEAEKQQMRDEIDTEVTERVLAATRTQVSLNRDSAWSQNASGRKWRVPKEESA
jgi:hypothetical protein